MYFKFPLLKWEKEWGFSLSINKSLWFFQFLIATDVQLHGYIPDEI